MKKGRYRSGICLEGRTPGLAEGSDGTVVDRRVKHNAKNVALTTWVDNGAMWIGGE